MSEDKVIEIEFRDSASGRMCRVYCEDFEIGIDGSVFLIDEKLGRFATITSGSLHSINFGIMKENARIIRRITETEFFDGQRKENEAASAFSRIREKFEAPEWVASADEFASWIIGEIAKQRSLLKVAETTIESAARRGPRELWLEDNMRAMRFALHGSEMRVAELDAENSDLRARVSVLETENERIIEEAKRTRTESERMKKLFSDSGQGQYDVLGLIDHYQDLNLKLSSKIRSVIEIISENGCDCECGCDTDGHDDDCEVCLACRVGEVVKNG